MTAEEQIQYLADYILAEIPGEPSQNEGAGETAVRLLTKYRAGIKSMGARFDAIEELVSVAKRDAVHD